MELEGTLPPREAIERVRRSTPGIEGTGCAALRPSMTNTGADQTVRGEAVFTRARRRENHRAAQAAHATLRITVRERPHEQYWPVVGWWRRGPRNMKKRCKPQATATAERNFCAAGAS